MKIQSSLQIIKGLKLVFAILLLIGLSRTLLAQTYENYLPISSPIISIESSLSMISIDGKSTSPLSGIALHNYWNLKSFGDNNNSFIGLDIPFRFIVIDEKEGSGNVGLLDYQDQFSLAVLIRWDRHITGDKRKLGFFVGAGPEFRSSFKSNGYMFVPFVQQEIGFNLQFARFKSSFLKSQDLGIAFSLPIRKEERRLSMTIGSLFYRFSI